MRSLTVLVILTSTLAGCLDEAPAADLAPPLAVEVYQITPGASGETFLAVGDEGLILACTHGGFVGPSPTFISRDNGTTWSPLDTGNVIPAGDCDVAISASGAWVVLYDNVWGATTAVSRDEGATWTLNHHGAPPVTGAVDRPWIEWVGERLVMTYKSVQYHPTLVAATTSDDDGATWSAPQILDFALDLDFPAALTSDIHVDNSTAYFFLTSYQTNPMAAEMGFQTEQRYEVFRSVDAGDTWQRSFVYEGPGEVINGAGAGGGYLWWAYAGPAEDGGGESVWLMHSLDAGLTWEAPIAVAHGGNFDTPAIAGRPDGTASLLVLNRAGGPFIDLIELDPAVPGLVSASVRVEEDNGLQQSAEFMDITHDATGIAYATYAWDRPGEACGGSMNPLATFCLWMVRQV